MRTASVDTWISAHPRIFPPALFTHAAAAAVAPEARPCTTLPGTFVDHPAGVEVSEVWSLQHTSAVNDDEIARLRVTLAPNTLVEHAAITVVGAVLLARDGLRVGDVLRIGSGADYRLVDPLGNAAGVLEVKGRAGSCTASASAEARTQVRRGPLRPQRVGVVAFGGPKLRIEVVG